MSFLSAMQCLAVIARLKQVPVDIATLSREFTPPKSELTDIELLKAARSPGFKAMLNTIKPEKIQPVLLPAIGRRRDGGYFILARLQQGKALLRDVASGGSLSFYYRPF